MKIAFDSNIFTLQKYGGVSRYLVKLGEEFTKAGHDVRVHGLLHTNRHLTDSSCEMTEMRMIDHFPPLTRRATHCLNDLWMELQLKREVPDLIHESYCHNRQVGSKSLPRVCTVHDMIHELFPQYVGKMDSTPEYRLSTIARANAVICVSESTRRDLLRLTGLDENKVHVVHHGFENNTMRQKLDDNETALVEELASRPYLLYVGGRQGYKNFSGFLRGFAESVVKHDALIFAFGGGDFTDRELAQAKELGIPLEALMQTGGSDSMLRALYRGATAFIYPSLYEGFGFPPLEAMSEGCPVISSNASCMPEVIGDAAEFFDPEDSRSITTAINRVFQSDTLRADLVQRGNLRLKAFSWKKCAEQTMRIYKSIA